jgi:hypothetical protein
MKTGARQCTCLLMRFAHVCFKTRRLATSMLRRDAQRQRAAAGAIRVARWALLALEASLYTQCWRQQRRQRRQQQSARHGEGASVPTAHARARAARAGHHQCERCTQRCSSWRTILRALASAVAAASCCGSASDCAHAASCCWPCCGSPPPRSPYACQLAHAASIATTPALVHYTATHMAIST